MKYINIKSTIVSACIMAVMGFTSCVGDLDVTPIDPNVKQDFDQTGVFAKIYATMALTGQEGPAGNKDVDGIDEGFSAFYRLIVTLNGYPTDEVICSWGDTGIPELNFISWSSSHDQVTGMYARLYFNITLCNHFLEMTEGQEDDASVKQRAEARFMRAMNYFYLMDFYGRVPYVVAISDELPSQYSRASMYAFIESELSSIESDMYAPGQAPYGRADQAANWLLRARLYLNAEVYTGTAAWTQAASYAKKVMDSSYSLAPVYAHLFMADNDGSSSVNQARQEIILPIRMDGAMTKTYGGSFYSIAATRTEGMTPWGSVDGWGGVRARAALVQKFFPNLNVPNGSETEVAAAANDDRALFFNDNERTVEVVNVNTFKNGLSICKWTNIRVDGKSTSDTKYTDTDVPFMRLTEAYMTYAEASFRSGNTSEALATINIIRNRANASSLATLTLDTILDEWAREFYFEGRRRMDLIRFGLFTTNDYIWDWKGGNAEGTSVNSFYNIFPIPFTDMNANNKLVQNPGY